MASADVASSNAIDAAGDTAVHTSNLHGDAVLLTHELQAALHDQLRLVSYETQLAVAVREGKMPLQSWIDAIEEQILERRQRIGTVATGLRRDILSALPGETESG